MKALTICQPYAHLIVVSRAKRVENRTWATSHRGDLLIHAGLSRKYLGPMRADTAGRLVDGEFGIGIGAMSFGAIIGVATLVDCVPIGRVDGGEYDTRFPWLREHAHTHGPWCWVLDNVRQLVAPFAFRGAPGLFHTPIELEPGIAGSRVAWRTPR